MDHETLNITTPNQEDEVNTRNLSYDGDNDPLINTSGIDDLSTNDMVKMNQNRRRKTCVVFTVIVIIFVLSLVIIFTSK